LNLLPTVSGSQTARRGYPTQFFKRILPKMLHTILVPSLVMVVGGVLALVVAGTLGNVIALVLGGAVGRAT
jgi:hypothetical protein